jgi:hypothetical protein
MIDLQYADDLTWITGNYRRGLQYVEETIPTRLSDRNLTINQSKTEIHNINYQNREGAWRDCKYLGSLLDTDRDIMRRKKLTLVAFSKLKPIFKDRNLNLSIKIRIFDALVSSIFLYNSELWTVTKTRSANIDAFHRKLLRWIMNIRYPNTMSNESVYKTTKQTRWSTNITTRRLRWFGHMARLPPQTPVR